MPPPPDHRQGAVVDGSDPRTARVVVVGAGVAGLVAARELSAAHDVVVLDKARGVGGRMATRRIGDATFDHGAQFFTTHTETFARIVRDWVEAGVAAPWYHGQVGPSGVVGSDGHPRFRGVPTMNAVAKHLVVGLDVHLSSRIITLRATESGWSAVLEDGTTSTAGALVVTAPVPQALELLDAGDVRLTAADRAVLEAITYDPCLAVLAPLEGLSGLPEPGALDPDALDPDAASTGAGPIDWMADNQTKGVSAAPAVTIHATAEFSRQHRDSPDGQVIAELIAAAALGAPVIEGAVQVQRWRYAKPSTLHPQPCLVASGTPPLVFAGDAFGGAKVEGAVLSGLAAADALAGLLR